MKRTLFCLAWLIPSLALAAEEQRVAATRTFTIGVQDFQYSPHSFMQEGRYSGFGRDVLDLFASHAGYQFVYVPQPYIRNVVDLLKGKIDFQYPDSPKWLPDKKSGYNLVYSDGVVGYVDGINRHRADLGQPLSEIQSLVMPIGWTAKDYEPLEAAGQLTIDRVASVTGVIAMLLRRRADGAYLNADVVNDYVSSLGRAGEVSLDTTLPYSFGEFVLSSQKHPQIIKEFNEFLQHQADSVSQLKQDYGFKFDVDPKAHSQ
jgi:polar amino acid transport system substrate-binding protein